MVSSRAHTTLSEAQNSVVNCLVWFKLKLTGGLLLISNMFQEDSLKNIAIMPLQDFVK